MTALSTQKNSYEIAAQLKTFIREKKATALFVGPMSQACVDACLEIVREFELPLPLIASRRQVEAAEFGGGYVNGWNSRSFAEYVISRDQTGYALVARDHGGPYQNVFETDQNFSLEKAMASAKASFEEDIDSGFHILHIDPSVPKPGETLTMDIILDRLFELYEHCYSYAQKKGKAVQFELGTEEQSGYGQDLEAFRTFLAKTQEFCQKNKITPPLFVVSQTGTKVLETENVGKVAHFPDNVEPQYLNNLGKSVAIANEYGLMIKEHNGDYINAQTLQLRPLIGIQGCNVAPEFGVEETRALVYLLKYHQMFSELETFLGLAYKSGKWKKWMKSSTSANDFDRSIICGHYVFAYPEVTEIKQKLQRAMAEKNQSLDTFLKNAVKASIFRYLAAFNML